VKNKIASLEGFEKVLAPLAAIVNGRITEQAIYNNIIFIVEDIQPC